VSHRKLAFIAIAVLLVTTLWGFLAKADPAVGKCYPNKGTALSDLGMRGRGVHWLNAFGSDGVHPGDRFIVWRFSTDHLWELSIDGRESDGGNGEFGDLVDGPTCVVWEGLVGSVPVEEQLQ
jgi:hypothetical protein